MKNICALTKVFLKENLFRNFEKNRIRKIIIYACVYIYLCGFVLYISYSCISGLKMYGEEQLFINVILIAYLLLIAIRLIFSCMNVLYYSNDNEVICTYPVYEKDIISCQYSAISHQFVCSDAERGSGQCTLYVPCCADCSDAV